MAKKSRCPEAYEVIKSQFYEELGELKELARELNLPLSGSELLKYSGLMVSEYTVKGKYHYYKLVGVLTGNEADKLELWLVRRENEAFERKRAYRRRVDHLANLKRASESRERLQRLIKCWRRAKALQKWLELSGS